MRCWNAWTLLTGYGRFGSSYAAGRLPAAVSSASGNCRPFAAFCYGLPHSQRTQCSSSRRNGRTSWCFPNSRTRTMTSNTLAGVIAALIAVTLLGFTLFLVVNRRRQPEPDDRRLMPRGMITDTQVDEYHLVYRIHDGQNSRVWEVFDEV